MGDNGSPVPSSPSIENADYWWYRARSRLLETVFRPYLRRGSVVVDVGSADGPSVGWMEEVCRRIPIDIDVNGLRSGGLCASADNLPFRRGSLDALTAFDVIEHVDDDVALLTEFKRVLRPDGHLLISVPAYQWAWTSFDVQQGHVRRYTRQRVARLLERTGFLVERATYAFAAVFPLFAADRMLNRLTSRPPEDPSNSTVSPPVERLLMGMTRFDEHVLRNHDLPFGSSVFAAARAR